MANIRASAAVTTILVATASAVSIGIATAGGVTATAQPTPVIRASAFAVPMSVLENQTVLMSDFRSFDIGQVTIDVATVTDDVAISFNTSFSDTVAATDVINKMFYGNVDYDPTDPDADPDPITMADSDAKNVGKTLTDTAAATDTALRDVGKALSDSVTSAEAINTKHVGKPSTDAVTAADAVNTINTAKVVADSVTPAEALTKELTRPDVADSVTTADTSFRSPGLGKTDSVTGSDAINTFAVNKPLTDTATASDTAAKDLTRPDVADTATMADDKFYYAWTPGMLNRHLIHQPLVNGEFVLTTDQNAGIVYTIRTESYSYMFAGYGLNENQLN